MDSGKDFRKFLFFFTLSLVAFAASKKDVINIFSVSDFALLFINV